MDVNRIEWDVNHMLTKHRKQGRNPIPREGETAKDARARGCLVPYSISDNETVVLVEDDYPARYVWSIHWTNGVVSGVRGIKDVNAGSQQDVNPRAWMDVNMGRM
jgi:hypothetical protein